MTEVIHPGNKSKRTRVFAVDRGLGTAGAAVERCRVVGRANVCHALDPPASIRIGGCGDSARGCWGERIEIELPPVDVDWDGEFLRLILPETGARRPPAGPLGCRTAVPGAAAVPEVRRQSVHPGPVGWRRRFPRPEHVVRRGRLPPAGEGPMVGPGEVVGRHRHECETELQSSHRGGGRGVQPARGRLASPYAGCEGPIRSGSRRLRPVGGGAAGLCAALQSVAAIG